MCRDHLADRNRFVVGKPLSSLAALPALGEVNLSDVDSHVTRVAFNVCAFGPLVFVELGHVEVLAAVIVLRRRHAHSVGLGHELAFVEDLNGAATVVEDRLDHAVGEHWPFVLVVVEPGALPSLLFRRLGTSRLDIGPVDNI